MTTSPFDADSRELEALRGRAKKEIRRQLRSVRGVLPYAACAERAARASTHALSLPELTRAKTVVAYVAMRKELSPEKLCEELRAQGKVIGLPRVNGETLTLHVHEAGAKLVENEMGVLEPAEGAPELPLPSVDVIFVPALALDPRGYRIGYGGGFYDRLLPALPNAFKVGFIYDFQLIAEAPNDPHDAPIDCIVTDARIMRAER